MLPNAARLAAASNVSDERVLGNLLRLYSLWRDRRILGDDAVAAIEAAHEQGAENPSAFATAASMGSHAGGGGGGTTPRHSPPPGGYTPHSPLDSPPPLPGAPPPQQQHQRAGGGGGARGPASPSGGGALDGTTRLRVALEADARAAATAAWLRTKISAVPEDIVGGAPAGLHDYHGAAAAHREALAARRWLTLRQVRVCMGACVRACCGCGCACACVRVVEFARRRACVHVLRVVVMCASMRAAMWARFDVYVCARLCDCVSGWRVCLL